MAVTENDVRHIAGLARLGLAGDRVPALVEELNGILGHMKALAKVKTEDAAPVVGVTAGGMPLREDTGPPIPLARALADFAPLSRDGFLIVPRLATHAAAAPADDEAAG